MSWMESTERSFDRLVDETGKADVIQNKDLCHLYLEEFRVSLFLPFSYNILCHPLSAHFS